MKKALFLLALAAGLGLQVSATTFNYIPYAMTGGGPGWVPGIAGNKSPNAAIKFNSPTELNGWKLTGLILTSNTFANYATSMDMWWSQNLWTSQPDGELVSVPNVAANSYKITFTNPKVLDGTDFYIGCNAVLDPAKYTDESKNLWYCFSRSKQPGTWMQQNADGTWTDYSATKGGIYLQAELEAPADWQDNSVSVSAPKVTTFKKNTKAFLALPMFNYSTHSIGRFNYTVAIDGNVVISKPDYNITNGETLYFSALSQRYLAETLTAEMLDLTPGTHTMTFTLSQIAQGGGTLVDNNATNKSVTFDINIVDDVVPTLNQDAVVTDYNNQSTLGWFNVGVNAYPSHATFSGARKYKATEDTKGMQIIGARVDKQCYISVIGNDCLWLSSSLGDKPDGEIVYGELIPDTPTGNRASLTVAFANPVEFTEDGIYVGISRDFLTYNQGNYQVLISYLKDDNHKNIEDGCWLKNDYSGWQDNMANGGMAFTLYLKKAGTSTGIVELTADGEAAQYFDLQGRQVLTPQHGIFIKRVGNKILKVAL